VARQSARPSAGCRGAGRARGITRPSFRSSSRTRPTWASSIACSSGVSLTSRPSGFLVVPGSRRSVPSWALLVALQVSSGFWSGGLSQLTRVCWCCCSTRRTCARAACRSPFMRAHACENRRASDSITVHENDAHPGECVVDQLVVWALNQFVPCEALLLQRGPAVAEEIDRHRVSFQRCVVHQP
jgi:hypothetical protein